MNNQEIKVFISYASEDVSFARRLHSDLAKFNIKVWFDDIELLGGDRVKSVIDDRIQNSNYFIVIISSNVHKKGFINWEIDVALETASYFPDTNRFIIPVMLENTDLPKEGLRKYKRINMYGSFESGFKELLLSIDPSKINKINSFQTNFRLFSRVMAEEDILPKTLWPDAIKVQPSNFRDIYFQMINGREATRGKRHTADDIKSQLYNYNSVVMVIGESGIGKTTLCRWLSKQPLVCQTENIQPSEAVLPIIIMLREVTLDGDCNILTYVIPIFDITLYELIEIAALSCFKIILFLDGLNEIIESKRDLIVSKLLSLKMRMDVNISIMFTSRSVGVNESLCSLFGGNLNIYEIQRWNDSQLLNYFSENNIELALLKGLPQVVLKSLRLPLFAWLFLQAQRSPSNKPLHTIGDVFSKFIDTWLAPNINDSEHYQAISPRSNIPLHAKKQLIGTIAYQMTQANSVIVNCAEIEACLQSSFIAEFSNITIELVNSGILRCVGRATIDDNISIEHLRSTNVMFLHQALQEYLTAEYLSTHPGEFKLLITSTNISKDAFWREVPIFMMRTIDQTTLDGKNQAIRLMSDFLDNPKPDFWTAARLVNETNAQSKNKMKKVIVDKLVLNLTEEITYEYNLEAFKELGEVSRQALLDRLGKCHKYETIISQNEIHLHDITCIVGITTVDGVEYIWRDIGRSLTKLGELGEIRLIEMLLPHINNIRSLHLTYHVLEAFLLIIRLNPGRLLIYKKLKQKLEANDWLHHSDPIIAAYTYAIIKAVTKNIKVESDYFAHKLVDFLKKKTSIRNEYFQEEFWQRAHAIIVLSEVSNIDDALNVMMEVVTIENGANYDHGKYIGSEAYSDGKFKGYIAVHSAILTSLNRLHEITNVEFNKMQEVIDMIIESERVGENKWACRWLEQLLLRICTENEKEWFEACLVSENIPNTIKRVISNVAHMLI